MTFTEEEIDYLDALYCQAISDLSRRRTQRQRHADQDYSTGLVVLLCLLSYLGGMILMALRAGVFP